jgi:hypothetical protein
MINIWLNQLLDQSTPVTFIYVLCTPDPSLTSRYLVPLRLTLGANSPAWWCVCLVDLGVNHVLPPRVHGGEVVHVLGHAPSDGSQVQQPLQG